jgi:hypothetical protein
VQFAAAGPHLHVDLEARVLHARVHLFGRNDKPDPFGLAARALDDEFDHDAP